MVTSRQICDLTNRFIQLFVGSLSLVEHQQYDLLPILRFDREIPDVLVVDVHAEEHRQSDVVNRTNGDRPKPQEELCTHSSGALKKLNKHRRKNVSRKSGGQRTKEREKKRLREGDKEMLLYN